MLELSSIISSLREDASLSSLEEALERMQQSRTATPNPRYTKLEAELCFLVAKEIKDSDPVKAREYAEKAVQNYQMIDTDTLEGAQPILYWLLPSLMHEGVVKKRILDA
jgi:hypothetical protein